MGYVGRKPADAALTSADIAPGSVDTAQLAADAVTTAKIAPATVASSDIAPATIAASNIAPGTVTTTQIAPGTIAASNIAPGTITTTQIAPATVAASNIAPGTITTTQISPAVPLGVPAVSSDPPSPNEGDMWLRKDLTSNQLKAYLTAATSFSSAPNYPITAYALVGAGTGTDTTFVGGFQMPGSSSTNTSNEYDGTSFSGAPNYRDESGYLDVKPGTVFDADTDPADEGTQTSSLDIPDRGRGDSGGNISGSVSKGGTDDTPGTPF